MVNRGMENKKELDKEKLKELVFIDDLTSLYNRRYLSHYLPGELQQMQKEGKGLCLFMMDVDTFKSINDTYGHLFGDKILVGVSDVLRKCFRGEDTIIRYAGDEFLAIMPGAEQKDAVSVGKKLVEEINKRSFKETQTNRDVRLTLSIGIASFPGDAQDPQALIHQADQALYSSKRGGRNRFSTTKDILPEVVDEGKIEAIFPSSQLINRDEQLTRLKALLTEATGAKAKLALVKGEKGVGKSRLIKELENYARSKGIRDINVSCSAEMSKQPYQPLITALEKLFVLSGEQARGFLKSLPEGQAAQLVKYIPVIKEFAADSIKTAGPQSEKEALMDLFKAIYVSLVYFVRQGPVVLVMDDFHWVDKETVQLFSYIMSKMRNIPLFIIGGYRETELRKRKDSFSPGEVLEKIKHEKLAEEFTLEPLEKKDVREMIKVVFADMELTAGVVDVIYEVSAGNPLFMEEVIRTLVNKGFIFYRGGKWSSKKVTEAPLPSLLKEAIEKRVAGLDEETRPVLSAAAVMGQNFDFNLLCQLVGQNAGYVLDILDKATKQQLVTTESPLRTDKFKFNSGVIQDVIYNKLETNQRQQLHRKLALIEERTYRDNVDSMAGALDYHFNKAQDIEKAAFYGKILADKVNQLPVYEDMFDFLQNILTEEREEAVLPLTSASMSLVGPLVRSLRLGVQSVRLYPAHSAVRKDFIERAYVCLNRILEKNARLVIRTAEGRMLINDEEISRKIAKQAGAGDFTALMVEHRLKNITFERGFKKAHLGLFFETLSQTYDDLLEKGGLAGVLRAQGVANIKINEIRLDSAARLQKQKKEFQEAMLMDYLIGKTTGVKGETSRIAVEAAMEPEKLAQALTKMASKVPVGKGEDKVEARANAIREGLLRMGRDAAKGTREEKEQYRRNIAQTLRALDYEFRSKIIQGQTSSGGEGFIHEAINEFSDEQILEMLKKEFSRSKGNPASLRDLLHGFFLKEERRKALEPKLKAELLKMGLSEENVSFVMGENLWQGLSPEEMVKRLVGLSSDNYFKLEISKQQEKLITDLLQKGLHKDAAKIIDKLLKQLEDKSEDVCNVTISDLERVSSVLILKEEFSLLEQVIKGLVARWDKEERLGLYSSLSQLLAAICTMLIKKQTFLPAARILKEFNLRTGKESSLTEAQKEAVKACREKTIVTDKMLNWLVELLKKKVESHQDSYELSKVITEIGTAAIGPMFDMASSEDFYADPFKAYSLRWAIAKILKTMQEDATVYLGGKLEDSKVAHVRLSLEILGHMKNKDALKYLRSLLKHKDAIVRKEAINTIGKIGGSEAVTLLSEFLKDTDTQNRFAVVRALGVIGTPDVLPVLKPLLKDKELSGAAEKIISRVAERK